MTPEFEGADLEVADFEAVARRDAGSAAATDGLSRRSVFGALLEKLVENRACRRRARYWSECRNHCGLPDSGGASRVFGDDAVFHCNDSVF